MLATVWVVVAPTSAWAAAPAEDTPPPPGAPAAPVASPPATPAEDEDDTTEPDTADPVESGDAPPDAGPDPAEASAPGPDATDPASDDAALSVEPRATHAPSPKKKVSAAGVTAPSAAAVRSAPTRLSVGVGLSPSAPGSKSEKALVKALQRSIASSKDPVAKVRHVSAGAGEPRLVCRERRDDFVVMIGYIADRPDPVVLAHDCRLDRSLSIRGQAAARSKGLLAALWDEHETLVRQGVRERRGIRRLSPTARGVIIASVAVAVVGTAVGILVANALRDDKVVITVSP